jgi:hypothetical protein
VVGIDFSLMLSILLILLGLVLAMIAILYIGWLSTKAKITYILSLYAKVPVRPLLSARPIALNKVYLFVEALPGYDNQIFNFKRSVYCRETGRIFPNCVDWKGKVTLDWRFLSQRCRGHWISWGSLSEEQRRDVRERHGSFEGFQTDHSCPNPKPVDILPEYIFVKPGPLYVDLVNYKLLGWKCVPETDFEVLVVQLPKKYIANL